MDSLSFTGIRNCFYYNSGTRYPDGKEGEKKTLEVMKVFIPIAAVGFILLYWFAHSLMKAGKDKPLHFSEYDDTENFYNE